MGLGDDTASGAVASMILDQRTLRLSRYRVCSDVATVDGTRLRVVMATRTGEVIQVASELWDRLVAGELDGLAPEMIELLTEIELLVPDEDELAVVLGRSNRAIETSGTLKLVVQPSAACQLDCVYCGQEHTSTRLCAGHQQAVIDRAEQRLQTGDYHTLSIGWFGSEPLLGLDVIRTMTGPLLDLAAAHACEYDATVVTNGLRLTPAIAQELAELHVTLVEVTIDGPGHWHDLQRPYKSGRSSFDRILHNVVDVARSDPGFALSIRCNVTAASAPDIPDFIDLLAALGLQDGVDRVYFAPVHSWGNDANEMSLDRGTFASREISWMARLLGHGFEVGSLPEPKPIVCMATSKTAELVDAYGEIFNCTEVSYVPAYGTPNKFSLGNLDTGINEKRRNLLGDFNTRIAQKEVPCNSCHLLPVCGGSCPKAWLEGEAPCPSYKWHLPTRLLLELARHREPPPDISRAHLDTAEVLAEFASRHGGDTSVAPSTPVVLRPARPRDLIPIPADPN